MLMASPTTRVLALAASFLVLLSLAHGAIYRTVVTTTETFTDDETGPEEQRCREELDKHSLGSCRSYLRQDEEKAIVRRNQQEGSVPQQCCEQMRDVRDDCTCYVLRRMVEKELEQEQEGEGGPEQQRSEMLKRAQQIPSECDLKTGGCQISAEI